MKSLYIFLVLALCLAGKAQAQLYYGFQSINVHTLFVSIGWEGKPTLGAGYNLRLNSRTDWSAELRFPADQMWKCDNYSMILGMYRPFMVRKGFLAAGVHARIRKTTTDAGKLTTFSLAGSLLPSFAYAAPLGEQPGGTVALRATFAPVLASYYKGQGSEGTANGWKGWPGAYHLEVGGHADLQLERTLGIGLNGTWNKIWQKSEILPSYEQLERPITGDLTLGAAYWLRRRSF